MTSGRTQGEGAYLISYDRSGAAYKPMAFDVLSLQIANSGGTAMNVTGGLVGIGIGATTAAAPLEVKGDGSNDVIRLQSNSSGNYCILRMSDTTTCGTGTLIQTNGNRALCLVCN